jgi:hypothetical protein
MSNPPLGRVSDLMEKEDWLERPLHYPRTTFSMRLPYV